MAPNPFLIEPPNLLQAIQASQQGYDSGVKRTQLAALQDAAALYESGDLKGAQAAAARGGNLQAMTSFAQIANNDADRLWRREEATRTQQNADRNFGLQEKQLSATLGNQAATRDLQRQELDLKREALKRKDEPNIEAEVAARKKAVVAQGLNPDDPNLRAYVLSGKMPREDQQPLTATDKKAILDSDDAVLAANTAIDNLRKAKELSPKAYGFKGAGLVSAVGSMLPGEGASEATKDLDNLVTTNALSQLKAIFGGAPTEGERQILLDIQGSSALPDKIRQRIYDRAIGLAQNRLKLNQDRANELRGGTFYKPAGGKPSAAAPAATDAPDPLGIR